MTHPQPYGYAVPTVHTQVLVQPYRCSTAHVVVAWVLAVLTGLYLLPWAVGATRNRRNVGAVALVNLLLGWTLVGWVVALVMACGSDRPVVTVQHTYAPGTYAPPPPYGPPLTWVPQPPQAWVQPPAPAALTSTWSAPASEPTAEVTRVDPLGTEPTQPLPRSPWEPDHRR